MRQRGAGCLGALILGAVQAGVKHLPPAVAESSWLEAEGHFAAAANVLRRAMSEASLTDGDRRQLEFELELTAAAGF